MKIAIMTWFSYGNYGTALQAYALYHFLKSDGHDVDVIRYYPRKMPKGALGENICQDFVVRVLRKIHNVINPQIMNRRYDELFLGFIESNLTFTKTCETFSDLKSLEDNYDAFICGSDQIWTQRNLDPHYYLDFVSAKYKKIAYAPSMGSASYINDLYKKNINELVNNISFLSIREKSTKELLEKNIGKKIINVVDPVLLFDSNRWSEVSQTEGSRFNEYALVYFLGDNIKSWNYAYKISKLNNLEIRIIPTYKRDFRRSGIIENNVDPECFINLFKNASLVITDSFHGVLFSVIFEKNFWVLKRFKGDSKKNQNVRLYDFLERLDLQSRIIKRFHDYNGDRIDYVKVKTYLVPQISESKDFLEDSLERINELNRENEKDNGKI